MSKGCTTLFLLSEQSTQRSSRCNFRTSKWNREKKSKPKIETTDGVDRWCITNAVTLRYYFYDCRMGDVPFSAQKNKCALWLPDFQFYEINWTMAFCPALLGFKNDAEQCFFTAFLVLGITNYYKRSIPACARNPVSVTCGFLYTVFNRNRAQKQISKHLTACL